MLISPNRKRSENVLDILLESESALEGKRSGLDSSQVGGGGSVGRSLNGGGGSGTAHTLRAVSAVVLSAPRLESAVVDGLLVLILGSEIHGGGVGGFDFSMRKVDHFDFGRAGNFSAGFSEEGLMLTCI